MSEHLATLIHFSDLHLFVDARGNLRSPSQRDYVIRALETASRWGLPGIVQHTLTGIYYHEPSALQALLRTIPPLLERDGDDVRILVQSGDVEAFGADMRSQPSFPAFDFLDSVRATWPAATYVGVFGNHDVWPGTVPLLGELYTRPAVLALRGRSEFQGILPDVTTVAVGGSDPLRIEIYRLDSVCSDALSNFWAIGDLTVDSLGRPHPRSSSLDPLAELDLLVTEQNDQHGDDRALRIVVLHHPPHKGQLFRGGELAARLHESRGSNRIHLILAGHTHRVNPAHGRDDPQPPLPAEGLQLVAGTATRRVDPGQSRPSFSVYGLHREGDEIVVERTIYEFRGRLNSRFSPAPREVVRRIAL